MIYRELKAAEGTLRVSGLAIGSAVKMQALSREALFGIYDCFTGHGGNCIDTARAYGGGRSEELVGEYIQSRGCREQIVLSTKCGHPAEDGSSRLDEVSMRADLEASLRALRTDYIDIYWVHKDDEQVPAESVIDSLNRFIREGKVRMIGASNWRTERIAAANAYAAESGQTGFGASQIQWSFAETLSLYFEKFTSLVMDEVAYGWYRENNMPVFAYSAQAQGFFQRAAAGGLASLNMEIQRNYGSPENMRRLARAEQYCREHGVPLTVPVLGYLIRNPLLCVPVIGSGSQSTLLESLEAVEKPVSSEDAAWLVYGGGEEKCFSR